MSYAVGKIMIDNLLNESEVFKNIKEELEKLTKENQELRVKYNKLLNDNFLIVAQYTNMVEDNTRLQLDNKALKDLNKKYKKQLKELKGE